MARAGSLLVVMMATASAGSSANSIWQEVLSTSSAASGGAIARATCPHGNRLVGCSCFSRDGSCAGAIIEGEECQAFYRTSGGGDSGVRAQARCGAIADVPSEMKGAVSGLSSFSNKAKAYAACPSGTKLTGCTCFSEHDACGGALADGDVCVAYNKFGGQGVYAQARCGYLPGSSDWRALRSDLSSISGGASAEVSCPRGATLTGCACFSEAASCSGSFAHGGTCRAINAPGGQGVYAQARCVNLKHKPREAHEIKLTSTGTSTTTTATTSTTLSSTTTSTTSSSTSRTGTGTSTTSTTRTGSTTSTTTRTETATSTTTRTATSTSTFSSTRTTTTVVDISPSLHAAWQEVRSQTSGRAKGAKAIAECPRGRTLTGCSCYSAEASCDGAAPEDGRCMAFSAGGGGRVVAQARCGIVKHSSDWQEVVSKLSDLSHGARSYAMCPVGTVLTGCSCYSQYAACSGAWADGNACSARNRLAGEGVYAIARCASLPRWSGWEDVSSELSKTSENAAAEAECPAGAILTGCACYSKRASCNGALAVGNTCMAFNKAGGSGVRAQARCGRDFLMTATSTGTHTATTSTVTSVTRTATSTTTRTATATSTTTRTGTWTTSSTATATATTTTAMFVMPSGSAPWVEVNSQKSDVQDEATAVAKCPVGRMLTSCTCFSPEAACDGAVVDDGDVCTAYSAGGGGVYAQARCGFVPQAEDWQQVISKLSPLSHNSATYAVCPVGTVLTGCSCYSQEFACSGALVKGNACAAYNKYGGAGVFAAARCASMPHWSQWGEVKSSLSGKGEHAEARATCPEGATLTGCTCYSEEPACQGALSEGNTCRAFNKAGGKGVYAQARCGRHPVYHVRHFEFTTHTRTATETHSTTSTTTRTASSTSTTSHTRTQSSTTSTSATSTVSSTTSSTRTSTTRSTMATTAAAAAGAGEAPQTTSTLATTSTLTSTTRTSTTHTTTALATTAASASSSGGPLAVDDTGPMPKPWEIEPCKEEDGNKGHHHLAGEAGAEDEGMVPEPEPGHNMPEPVRKAMADAMLTHAASELMLQEQKAAQLRRPTRSQKWSSRSGGFQLAGASENLRLLAVVCASLFAVFALASWSYRCFYNFLSWRRGLLPQPLLSRDLGVALD